MAEKFTKTNRKTHRADESENESEGDRSSDESTGELGSSHSSTHENFTNEEMIETSLWLRKEVVAKNLNIILGKEIRPKTITRESCRCKPQPDCGGEWVYVSKAAINAVLKESDNFIPCLKVIECLEETAKSREKRLREYGKILNQFFGIDFEKRISDDMKTTKSTINLIKKRRSHLLGKKNEDYYYHNDHTNGINDKAQKSVKAIKPDKKPQTRSAARKPIKIPVKTEPKELEEEGPL